MRAFAIAAALVIASAAPGLTQSRGSSFTLQNAASTPQAAVILDGTQWRCGADNVCVGTGAGANQPASRACRRVVAKVGAAVASFTYKGVTLTDDQLAACNTAVAGA